MRVLYEREGYEKEVMRSIMAGMSKGGRSRRSLNERSIRGCTVLYEVGV
jgi:hypothetical protein